MATLNEISLVLGLIASGLFYLQYKKYEAEAEKEEMINSFLSEWSRFKIQIQILRIEKAPANEVRGFLKPINLLFYIAFANLFLA